MDKTIKQVVHESVKDLHEIGLVDQVTMHEFDALCLPKLKELSPKEIKKLRVREKVSQPVLAKHLNVSPHTVKHWEQGTKRPTGSALLLLNIVLGKGLAAIEEGLTLNQNRQPFRSVRMKKKAHPELEIGGRIGG